MSQPASDAAVNENKIVRAKGASGITFSCREKETRKTVHLPEILFVLERIPSHNELLTISTARPQACEFR
jgi:hypothetical protein